MSDLEKLKRAASLADFAKLISYRPKTLSYILYKIPPEEKYNSFEIPKKSGDMRKIKAPCDKLKLLQKRLAELLYNCLVEIESRSANNKDRLNSVSFGFRKKRSFAGKKGEKIAYRYSIIENAYQHKKRRWVLNLDLKDFFPSFNFGRVRGFFIKDKKFALHPKIATLIAQIACDGEALPQGSPCSPIISVLIGQILDMHLVCLAKKYKVTYTRYADDIVFSTSQKNFPEDLAVQIGEGNWRVGEKLENIIVAAGFAVNEKKTRMAFRSRRQQITGLVVNAKVNIAQDYYRFARAMCYQLFTTGRFYLKNTGKIASPENKEISLNRLSGILSFIDFVKCGSAVHKDKAKNDMEDSAFIKLYKKFLFYKYCIALEKPLIITEGKTDIVHLRCAVKKLQTFHPLLGEADNGKFRYNISFLRHNGSRNTQILVGDGGTSSLKEIPLAYSKNFPKKDKQKILYKPMRCPVIIILDNDAGVGKNKEKHQTLLGTIKKNFSLEVDPKNPRDFYHITKNLYLIIMKKGQGQRDRAIENLYPQKWLDCQLAGKKFNRSNKEEPDSYGKSKFAEEVIAENFDKMTEEDFGEFVPLLESVKCVIEDHNTKKQ